MSLKDLWTMIKTAWQSKPIAMLIPPAALVYYYITHGHTFPSMHEWVAGIALWTAQFNQVVGVFFGNGTQASPPASRTPIFVLLGLGAVLSLTGCPPAGTTVPPMPPVTQPGIDASTDVCAGVSIDHAIADVATVAVDVVDTNWSALLDKLASQTSLQEAECAVHLFMGIFEKKAALDATAQQQRDRGLMWLHAKGVQ